MSNMVELIGVNPVNFNDAQLTKPQLQLPPWCQLPCVIRACEQARADDKLNWSNSHGILRNTALRLNRIAI